MRRTILRGVLALWCGGVWAVRAGAAGDPVWTLPADTVRLKPGPGAELTTATCVVCHSLDYITTQPLLTGAQWKATVTKMQQRYGAVLPAERVGSILDYLTRSYGRTP
jgi:sulfite dehydrogenase (cytochrome) subunit B